MGTSRGAPWEEDEDDDEEDVVETELPPTSRLLLSIASCPLLAPEWSTELTNTLSVTGQKITSELVIGAMLKLK